jgi:hypothetical protein
MARIRSVHPGLFTDEAYMSLTMAAKAALPALWTQCDDQGAFEWKPLVLKARIFPADDVDMAALLEEMEAKGCIKSYEYNGRQYGLVRNFQKWQKPKKPNSTYTIPAELRTYVAPKSASGEPRGNLDDGNEAQFPTEGEKSRQREDGGGRREDGGDNLALASEIARAQKAADAKEAQEGSTLVTPDDPPHWATIQTTLATRTADLDVWETDFLHSIKWARDLTKPQREKLEAITARLSAKQTVSDPTSPPARTRVPIVVDTNQWEAWRKHLLATGKRVPNPMDVKDAEGRRIGRGWYFDSEWPPPASDAAA